VEKEPFIVSVDKAAMEEISLNPGDWRPLALFRCRLTDITTITITPYSDGIQKTPLTLSLKASNWIADDRAIPGLINRGNLQRVLQTLANLNASQWTDEPGPLVPAMLVEYATANNRTGKLILGAAAADGSCLGTFQGQSGVFRLGAADVNALHLRLIDPLTR
jgi:hypothetical protein